MKLRPEWSQRLLRKGVLVQETYELFATWTTDCPTCRIVWEIEPSASGFTRAAAKIRELPPWNVRLG